MKKILKLWVSVVGVLGYIALIIENARAVTLARKRQSEANF